MIDASLRTPRALSLSVLSALLLAACSLPPFPDAVPADGARLDAITDEVRDGAVDAVDDRTSPDGSLDVPLPDVPTADAALPDANVGLLVVEIDPAGTGGLAARFFPLGREGGCDADFFTDTATGVTCQAAWCGPQLTRYSPAGLIRADVQSFSTGMVSCEAMQSAGLGNYTTPCQAATTATDPMDRLTFAIEGADNGAPPVASPALPLPRSVEVAAPEFASTASFGAGTRVTFALPAVYPETMVGVTVSAYGSDSGQHAVTCWRTVPAGGITGDLMLPPRALNGLHGRMGSVTAFAITEWSYDTAPWRIAARIVRIATQGTTGRARMNVPIE